MHRFFCPVWVAIQVSAATKSEHPENNVKLKRSANNKKETAYKQEESSC